MNWTEQLDQYCERLAPGLWAEPVNALSNLGFIAVALLMWHRSRGLGTARLLSGILLVIGLGSGLFHTVATRWAELADVLPVLAFVFIYIFLASRDLIGWPGWAVALAALGYVPLTALLVPVFAMVPGIGSSAGYMPLPVLILAYALLLRPRAPDTAFNFAIGAAILLVSITFRSLDAPICAAFPTGTHFAWHLFNAVMLGWMIETYRRHMLAGDQAAR